MSEIRRDAPRPVVLCILDGWGHYSDRDDNAITRARTPYWDRLLAEAPHCLLETSGRAVGLPDGQMGNSEVGHMNIGAGRVVVQNLLRIESAVADGSLAANPVLAELVRRTRESGGVCHLMGLMSPGGVHSHQDHIAALSRTLADRGVEVAVHAFLDGRDTPPQSARDAIRNFREALAGVERVRIATIGGRYYGMDRDKRWDRVEKAYRVIVDADGARSADPDAAIAASYAEGVTDEFVVPTAIGDYAGMRDGDSLLMANFRADRVRQILAALVDPAFEGFERRRMVQFSARVGVVDYSDELKPFLTPLFGTDDLRANLGEVVSAAGLRQLRIAETEKYAHVTYFLNGGEEVVYPGEERCLVPSPKVATYDLKPEMSAFEVTDRLVEAIDGGGFDLIVVNFANPDMVGHTGNFPAAVKAIEVVDACLARIGEAVDRQGGMLLITADHGNAEQMRDPQTGEPHTAHTTNPVPLVAAGAAAAGLSFNDGVLADIAPTVLALLKLPQPAEMTGRSLLARVGEVRVRA